MLVEWLLHQSSNRVDGLQKFQVRPSMRNMATGLLILLLTASKKGIITMLSRGHHAYEDLQVE